MTKEQFIFEREKVELHPTFHAMRKRQLEAEWSFQQHDSFMDWFKREQQIELAKYFRERYGR